ncbi:MAG: zinc-ribbon domain-containing protein [Promethearchaeota archaeon]
MSTNFCSNCGTRIEPSSRFCKNCGQRIISQKNDPQPIQQQYQTPSYQQVPTTKPIPKKNPGEAVLISFFLPGIGTIYADRSSKGAIIFCVFFVMLFLTISFWFSGIDILYSSVTPTQILDLVINYLAFLFSLFFTIIIWLFGMYDAYSTTKQYNQHVQQYREHPQW